MTTGKAMDGWRCFHCDEVFTDADSAREHFGVNEMRSPACSIDIAEYRRMEAIQARWAEEDTDLHRTMYAMQTKHYAELQRAEESGYAKGLKDSLAGGVAVYQYRTLKNGNAVWADCDLENYNAMEGATRRILYTSPAPAELVVTDEMVEAACLAMTGYAKDNYFNPDGWDEYSADEKKRCRAATKCALHAAIQTQGALDE